MTGKDSEETIEEYLKRLRENRGGVFQTKVLKHGASPRAIGATAASQILATMKKLKRDTLTYQRSVLALMFSDKALQAPRAGKPPTLKNSVREHLRARGIKVKYSGGLVDFIKIKAKQNPNI